LTGRKLVVINGSDFDSDSGVSALKLIMVNGSDSASDTVDSAFHSTKVAASDSGCSLEGMYVLGAGSGKTASFSDGSNGIRAWQRASKKNVTATASRAISFVVVREYVREQLVGM
jgi:hypothetical protein